MGRRGHFDVGSGGTESTCETCGNSVSFHMGSKRWGHVVNDQDHDVPNRPLVEPDPEPSYQMDHQPDPEGAFLHDLSTTAADIYDRPDDYIYDSEDPSYHQSMGTIRAFRGRPDARVTVFRSTPPDVRGIQPGNWITLSHAYAKQHGEGRGVNGKNWPVRQKTVRARHIRWAGDDINEFGYFPED